MSTNVTKILDNLRSNSEVKSNLERAKDKYEQKPFALEYASTYKAIERFGFIPSLISAAGGCLAFVTLMPNTHIAIPIILGAVLAGGYEVLKSWATALGFQAYFKHKSILALLLVALLYLGSVGLSTLGAYNGYQLLESDKVGSATAKHSFAVDSLKNHYKALIDTAQSRLNAFTIAQTDKASGSIRWGMRKPYKALSDRLTSLEDQKLKAVNELQAQRPNIIEDAKSSMGAYLWLALGVALLIELTIFCFRRFSEYYDYRSHSEVELLERGEVLQVDMRSLEKLAMLVQSSTSTPLQLVGATGRIGFKPKGEVKGEVKASDNSNPKCKNCGAAYTKSVSWQKYCSDSCREQYNNKK